MLKNQFVLTILMISFENVCKSILENTSCIQRRALDQFKPNLQLKISTWLFHGNIMFTHILVKVSFYLRDFIKGHEKKSTGKEM